MAARLGDMLGLPPRIIALASTLLIIFGQTPVKNFRKTWSDKGAMEAVAAAAAAVDAATAAAPLVGRRVRVEGLTGRPELNGRCGEATAYDAARGRYCVAVEGEPLPVLLRADNLTAIGHAAAPLPQTTGKGCWSGYFRVQHSKQELARPFEVVEMGLSRNGKPSKKRLGRFRTAAEAALWYARYLGPEGGAAG